ncbi:hypothetical protein [Methylophilus sp. QUAN]|uniref:hypothetical protein n=1 Tax=Methylophilus sp. QUAN TaxID=2781020 RepID=UPI00188DCD4C|nr:hypothetical protein [Methylophilus sp. QUAN]MBF4991069.1 hypothetical protein [Methylophilus sp. QUAN]
MSTTYTSGKQAGVFFLPNGEPIYALFEKTRESNLSPSIAKWSCFAIGNYSDAMKAIIYSASACVGGSLQGEGRRSIKPENYIAAWQKELANPVRILTEGRTISVNFKRDNKCWRSEDEPKVIEETKKLCEQLNRADLIKPLLEDNSNVTLSFDTEAEVISALFKVREGVFSAYRLFNHYDLGSMHVPLELPISDKTFIPPTVQAYRLPCEGMLVKFGDGPFKAYGRYGTYRIDQTFIHEVVLTAELHRPGAAKSLMKILKDAICNATELDENTAVVVHLPEQIKGCLQSYLSEVNKDGGLIADDEKTLTIKLSEFENFRTDAYYVYALLDLDDLSVEWQFANTEAAPVQKVQGATDLNQMSFF